MIVKQLTERERNLTLNFLNQEPALNLFIIGDILDYGFDSVIQTLWGAFDETNQLTGVLLRYRQNYIPYFIDDNFDLSLFASIIKQDSYAREISGAKHLIEKLLPYIDYSTHRSLYFCELKKLVPFNQVMFPVSNATLADVDSLMNMLELITEFKGIARSTNAIKKRVLSDDGRIYLIKNENDEVISTAGVATQTPTAAMIVSVATHPSYRGRGLVSACMTTLCEDLVNDNKRPCLFYDNPAAGSIYHKLGFETIGMWSMVSL